MNVSITSLVRTSGQNYVPAFYEISITLLLVVLGMWAFRLVSKHFKVFETSFESNGEVLETADLKQRELIFGK